MIYLDYAATNPFTKYPCSKYGQFLNPNANYAYKEQKLLDACANRVKAAIGAKSGKVIFGSTSSQLIENLMNAIRSQTASFYSVICSAYEHDSFFRYETGVVNNVGLLDKSLSIHDEFSSRFDTLFVLWQAVQNITGEIFPTKQIGELVHKHNGFYICDGTAQVGHTPIEPNIDDWCDFYCFSGHKIATELGIGCAWISDRLDKWLGNFKLHGTPNLAGAMAITDATEDACENAEKHESRAYELYRYMLDKFIDNDIHGCVVKGALKPHEPDPNEPCIINAIMFDDINADSLQQYLASKQIYIGIGGSACSSLHDFRVLNNCGLTNDEASRVVRVSFGDETTERDIDALVNIMIDYKEKFVR